MIRIDNRILIDGIGRTYENYVLPKIELVNRGEIFPKNYTGNRGYVRFTTSVANRIYIDFGDGTEVYDREFTGSLEIESNNPIHAYIISADYNVKIWFKFPSKITGINFTYCNFFFDFPPQISLYALNLLDVSRTRFSGFPLNFGATVLNTLSFHDATISSLNFIPEWITKSRIRTLLLGDKFNLSNTSVSNVDKIINIKDLWSLTFLNANSLTDIASNFKDITTLRYLAIGGANPTTSITSNINACKQIQHLSFGYVNNSNFGSTIGYGEINSWGVGLVGMSNLIGFYAGMCANLPTTVPTGLEDCVNIKTLYFLQSFQSLTRVNEAVTNYYNFTIANASMITGNTKFRQINFNITRSTGNLTPRPTGTYQAPTGYVQGSSNGTPASQMEMLYVLVKQYRWTCVITNTAGTGNETLTP